MIASNRRRDPPRVAPRTLPGAVQTGTAIGAMWGAGLATEYVAGRLAYHPHLGAWFYHAAAADRPRLAWTVIICIVVAVAVLPARRWRWGAVPLSLAALTATIARQAPLYSPERVFVWYAAYHGLRAYRQLFVGAWLIAGIVTLAVTVAALRLATTDDRIEGEMSPRQRLGAMPCRSTSVSGRIPVSHPWHAAAVMAPPDAALERLSRRLPVALATQTPSQSV
jgi:hypothetical protein